MAARVPRIRTAPKHSEAAGRSLGLELGQLNGEFVYPSTNRLSNQLKTLDHIGMFDKPLGKPVDQLIAYPDPLGTAGTLEQRARLPPLELRELPPARRRRARQHGPPLGHGAEGHEVLQRRRSPASLSLASSIVDDKGVKVLDDWIRSLTACP